MLIDKHRHLSGSIPIPTLWEILSDGYKNTHTMADLASEYTYVDDNRRDFETFLRKFDVMKHISWTEEKIDRVVGSVIKEIYKEHIKQCDIHFSVNKYLDLFGSFKDAANFVGERISAHAEVYGIQCDSILTVNLSHDLNPKKFTQDFEHVSGIGVAGDERRFDFEKLNDILSYWYNSSKPTFMHAGEVSNNTFNEIIKLPLNRIQHGIQYTNDQLAQLRDKDVWFDVALTSNLMTGVIGRLINHPIKRMLDIGCKVTISTDDPTVFCTDMRHEIRILHMLGIDHKEIKVEC